MSIPTFSQIVGQVANGAVSSNQVVMTASQNVPVGSLLVVVAKSGGGLKLSSASDSQGNTWSSAVVSNSASSVNCGVAWSFVTHALLGGTDQVTAQYSGSVTNLAAVAYQYTGGYTPAVGASGNNVANAASVSLAGNVTPQSASSLFIAALAAGSATITALTKPTNFTQRGATFQGGSSTVALADAALGNTTAFNPQWSWTTTTNAGLVVVEFLPLLARGGLSLTGVGS